MRPCSNFIACLDFIIHLPYSMNYHRNSRGTTFPCRRGSCIALLRPCLFDNNRDEQRWEVQQAALWWCRCHDAARNARGLGRDNCKTKKKHLSLTSAQTQWPGEERNTLPPWTQRRRRRDSLHCRFFLSRTLVNHQQRKASQRLYLNTLYLSLWRFRAQ